MEALRLRWVGMEGEGPACGEGRNTRPACFRFRCTARLVGVLVRGGGEGAAGEKERECSERGGGGGEGEGEEKTARKEVAFAWSWVEREEEERGVGMEKIENGGTGCDGSGWETTVEGASDEAPVPPLVALPPLLPFPSIAFGLGSRMPEAAAAAAMV